MKWLKRIVMAVLLLTGLLVIGLIAFMATFDANDYRPQLVKLVKQQTGRDLAIGGDIELILFSWRPGLALSNVSLSNAPGFPATPFAEIGRAEVELEWLPLLRDRSVEIVRIVVAGLRLRLARNEQGVANWDDLAQPAPATGDAKQAPSAGSGPQSAPPALGALTLGELRIQDARVEWRDAQSGMSAEVRRFDLYSGRMTLGEPFPLKFDLQVSSEQPALQAQIGFDGRITVDPRAQTYAVAGLALNVKARGEAIPVAELDATLAADIGADLAAQTLTLRKLRLGVLGVELSGEADVESMIDAPAYRAKLAVGQFDPRALMARLAIDPPETDDPDVLKSVTMALDVGGDLDSVQAQQLVLHLDQSTLRGQATARRLSATPIIRFELALDELDADRYLPPKPDEPPADAPTEPPGDEPLPIPLGLLADLDLEGQFKAGALKVNKARLSNLSVGLRARAGTLSIVPLTTGLYGGSLDGRVVLAARGESAEVALKLALQGVASEPLLKDVLDLDLVRGKADAQIDLTTRGIRVSELKSKLNGRIAASFTDGALKGFNLAGLLREAEARLKERDVATAKTERGTDFAAMSISANVRDGVLHTDDLDVRAPLLRVGGAGQVNLVSERLDYLAQVTLTDQKTGQGGATTDQLKGLTVPIRVRGPFADPKVSVELGKVLEARAREALRKEADAAERRLRQDLDAEKARLEQRRDAEKARLEQRLDAEKARLEEQKAKAEAELRAKQEEEKARAEEKLKQKLGDTLKKLF